MLIIDKTDAIQGGVYIILDIVNWVVYIGETDNLKRRADNHRRDLNRNDGTANKMLQDSFNIGNGLLWMVIFYGNKSKKRDNILVTFDKFQYRKIESFYIALLKNQGFKVFNEKQKESIINDFNKSDEDIQYLLDESVNALNDDFYNRFGYTIVDIRNKNRDEKDAIWRHFVEKVYLDIANNDKTKYTVLKNENGI